MTNTGEMLSPVLSLRGLRDVRTARSEFRLFVGRLNSERAQQDGADKCKHGAYREDIQLQG